MAIATGSLRHRFTWKIQKKQEQKQCKTIKILETK